MAPAEASDAPDAPVSGDQHLLNKALRHNDGPSPSHPHDSHHPAQYQAPDADSSASLGVERQTPRQVVAGLPRAQTFKRQQSERRTQLAPIETPPNERRLLSMERHQSCDGWGGPVSPIYRTESPRPLRSPHEEVPGHIYGSYLANNPSDRPPTASSMFGRDGQLPPASRLATRDASVADTRSITASQFDGLINDELEKTWILNLSMHFRDGSDREKFFVTYRESDAVWRRVTISLDYRYAPPESLEMELYGMKRQRAKSVKIYRAIRESLLDIQFYDTVTNLKLQTADDRLHIHVVEDGNEIINFPTVSQIRHLGCRRIRERDVTFDSHMAGFVYKVNVHGQEFIKKEIPSPETVEEFLYEINALHNLRHSSHVIDFYGVVVDDYDEYVKGLLIGYANRGALIDVIFDECKDSDRGIAWSLRERWARQIVQGLADIHESGFVQGDFTLSNIVIDENNDAKIIDINRRGCPVGWEPPEVTDFIKAGHRISMYIGVKSDLYQLGMVLWSLAMLEDEPEDHGRPLMLGPEINIPDWYRQMTEICLNPEPRMRKQAESLLQMFPTAAIDKTAPIQQMPVDFDDRYSLQEYVVDGYQDDGRPIIKTIEPPKDWLYRTRAHMEPSPDPQDPYFAFPVRGRSPPSPSPSHLGREFPESEYRRPAWAENRHIPSSYDDVGADDAAPNLVAAFFESTLRSPISMSYNGGYGTNEYVRERSEERISGDKQQCEAAAKMGAFGEHDAQRHMLTRQNTIRPAATNLERREELMPSKTNIDEPSLHHNERNASMNDRPVLPHAMPSMDSHLMEEPTSMYDHSRATDTEEESNAGGARIRSPTPAINIELSTGEVASAPGVIGQFTQPKYYSMTPVEPVTHLPMPPSNSMETVKGITASDSNTLLGLSHSKNSPPVNREMTPLDHPLDGGAALFKDRIIAKSYNHVQDNSNHHFHFLPSNSVDVASAVDAKEKTQFNRCGPSAIQESLSGIGAAHQNGDMGRQYTAIEEDFDIIGRPEMAPRIAITTEGGE